MGQTTGGVTRAHIRVGGIESEEELGYDDPMEAERLEIGRTRSSMGETIDEIQSRLTPGHLAESAKDTVVDMAGGMGHRVGGAVRANPVPAMLTAVGLGYLLFKAFSGGSKNGSAHGSGDLYGSSDMYGSSGSPRSAVAGAVDAAGDKVSAVGDKVSDVVDAAGEKVSDARSAVAHTAQAGMENAQQLGRTAAYKTSRTAKYVGRVISENPAAAVVVAIGIGAAAGIAFPSTGVEEKYLGSTGEEIVEKARETASDVGDRAKKAAHRAGDVAREEMSA